MSHRTKECVKRDTPFYLKLLLLELLELLEFLFKYNFVKMAVKMEGASPPVFEQIFRNARFAQGGNALFEGKVAGSPRPQVTFK